MVDRTYYTDGSELTYKENTHLVGFCTDLENYNMYYQTPPHYGQYVQLVHVLNYATINEDVMVVTVVQHVH